MENVFAGALVVYGESYKSILNTYGRGNYNILHVWTLCDEKCWIISKVYLSKDGKCTDKSLCETRVRQLIIKGNGIFTFLTTTIPR